MVSNFISFIMIFKYLLYIMDNECRINIMNITIYMNQILQKKKTYVYIVY